MIFTMNDNKGNFISLDLQRAEKEKLDIFQIGRIVEIHNSRFRIEKIYKNKLVLKLLPKLILKKENNGRNSIHNDRAEENRENNIV